MAKPPFPYTLLPLLVALLACHGSAHPSGDGGTPPGSDSGPVVSGDSGPGADGATSGGDGGGVDAPGGPDASGSGSWAGILAPSRAIEWSGAGVPGGIPSGSWTQCGSTIAPYGSSGSPASPSTINNAIAACAPNTYVQLGAGTFYLSSGIVVEGHNSVEVRGMGASSTSLVFSGADSCQGASATICFASSDINWAGGPTNVAGWTAASYAPGTTTISLASVPNLAVGNPILLDQLDSTTACSRPNLQRAVIPPSTRMFAPVIHFPRSDASNATTSATSSGDPRRPSGTDWANTSAGAPVASLNAFRASSPPGVITGPGDTTFTRMPFGPRSSASAREYMPSAAFAAQ